MKIYGGDKPKMPIDEDLWWWYNLKSPRMKIHGGDNLEMPKDENPWWWYNLKSPRMKIHGGDNWMKGDALDKLMVRGCPKQDDNRGMP